MALIIIREDGTKYIQVTISKQRCSVHLGEISQRDAERVRDKIEKLVKVRSQGLSLPRDVAAWVSKLSDEVAGRLAELNLIESRVAKVVVPVDTVGDFLTDYLSRRDDDVMNASLTFYVETVRNLTEFFGADRRLDNIKPGDADDFRRHLQKDEKLSAETVSSRCTLAKTFFKEAVRQKLVKTNPFASSANELTSTPCQRCENANAVAGEKFCRECRKAVVAEMKEVGFLERVPRKSGLGRDFDSRENTYETKHGTGHG